MGANPTEDGELSLDGTTTVDLTGGEANFTATTADDGRYRDLVGAAR